MQQDGWEAIFCSSKACPSRSPFIPAALAIEGKTIPTASGTFNSFLPWLKLLPVKRACQGQTSQRTPLQLTVSGGAQPSFFSPPAYHSSTHTYSKPQGGIAANIPDACADDCSSLTPFLSSSHLMELQYSLPPLTAPVKAPTISCCHAQWPFLASQHPMLPLLLF